jgi:hypothetical protein
MKRFPLLVVLCVLFHVTGVTAQPIDPLEYPRVVELSGSVLKIHHPVIDQWDDYATVEGWIPVEVTLAGSKTEYVGAVRARAATSVNLAKRLVTLSDQEVLEVRFSNTEVPKQANELALKAIRDVPHVVVLDALLGVLADDFEPPAQKPNPGTLSYQPPRIVVATEPTQVLLIDQEPVLAPISGTGLEFVVNTDWPLFRHPESGNWYLINGDAWQTHSMLATGGWNTTTDIPEDFRQLAMGDQWETVRDALPPRIPGSEPAPFIVSLEPTELILIDGPAKLAAAGTSGLVYVPNTDRDLFRLEDRWYLLLTGRWFEAPELDQQWRPVTRLPDAFASIPETHPRARARASVPGTVEAIVAMMEATLPQQRTVNADDAAALQVVYAGDPRFEAIEGTTLERALNSPGYVFRHNNLYYLCHDAAWFLSRSPDGPWSIAYRVPDEIYDIPATDPAYFVTFVRPSAQENAETERATFEFNSGYLGDFSTGLTVVQGTGWYYSPWMGVDPMGMPVYWSHPYTYGWHGYGPYHNRFYHYGGYWSRQTVSLESSPVGIGGSSFDPAFQDARLARRGYDYTTIQENRARELDQSLNADDDYYSDRQGNVYRQQEGEWSQHTGDGWSTMAELERQYGGSGYGTVGQVEAPQQQRQAYKQNPDDIERIKRWHERRSRSYNMHGYVTVYR